MGSKGILPFGVNRMHEILMDPVSFSDSVDLPGKGIRLPAGRRSPAAASAAAECAYSRGFCRLIAVEPALQPLVLEQGIFAAVHPALRALRQAR